MNKDVDYAVACYDRWRENIDTPLHLYILALILAHKDAGHTPEKAADPIQSALQRSWPATRTKKEN